MSGPTIQRSKTNVYTTIGTGLPCLDRVLRGVLPGDSIIWQVESIKDYTPFVHHFCLEVNKKNRTLVYFRFADHQQLVPDSVKAETYNLDPKKGFESFLSDIFKVIEQSGRGACYVFDNISGLTTDWYSDQMLGNFFRLTCSYLYDVETTSYFALFRNRHMAVATNAIQNTAQVVLDVYCMNEHLFIHPLKVYKRYSPTMYMVHRWQGNELNPVTNSAIISEILSSVSQPWLHFTMQARDTWSNNFIEAQKLLEEQELENPEYLQKKNQLFSSILHMAVSRDERFLNLAEKFFDLADLVNIGKRMIGTGLIGGKSAGMLLGRAILRKQDPRWKKLLEAHDSFYIGSDIFYTYLVQNRCWWIVRQLRKRYDMFDVAEDIRQRMLHGTFPEEIKAQFMDMLEYFGQSPIIVRSSSLLEDAYGNAFSGKYDSVFCANQGTPKERLDELMNAIRKVYASIIKKDTLIYRKRRGLLDCDEQMALLIQRVSGEKYHDLYFPHTAGVGFSFNPFVWDEDIDPQVGMLRLVMGLGTRAVDRSGDDYTRIVALNAPLKRPDVNIEKMSKYTQRKVDLLDLRKNIFTSMDFETIVSVDKESRLPLPMLASRDEELEQRAAEHNLKNVFSYILSFDQLLAKSHFVEDMRRMLHTLQNAYSYPVDIEFTTNFLDPENYRINLVQCRPFQVKSKTSTIASPHNIDQESMIIKTSGPIIGGSIFEQVDRLIYVVPSAYSNLNVSKRYTVARLIGRLTEYQPFRRNEKPITFLIGPGRWGTSTPSLGVPVSFSEINTVSILCEIAAMHEGLVPDISLGTHFFNDLIEINMLYMAIYPDNQNTILDEAFFCQAPNLIDSYYTDLTSYNEVIRVIDARKLGMKIYADSLKQEGICYCEKI